MTQTTQQRLRALIVTDQWPSGSDPSVGAFLQRSVERADGVEWRAIWLRRVFPPSRLIGRSGRLGSRWEDARGWLREVGSAPLPVVPTLNVRYTSPPRSRWEHTWGAWAMSLRGQRLHRAAEVWGPDVVHGHWAIPAGEVAVRLARTLGVSAVVSVHGSDLAVTAAASTAARTAVKRVLCDADLVVANSHQTELAIGELTDGRAEVRTLWQGGDLCAGSAETHAPARIVSVGHLSPHKGSREAALALGRCRADGLDFRWTVIGSGTAAETAQLRRGIEEAGLGDVTLHLPAMPNVDVLRALRAADLFVHLPAREAYGVVVAEALGAGLAVVGSLAAGAVQDFVSNGAPVSGVPADDVLAAAQEIAALIKDPEELRRVKHASADWARSHLGWDRYAQQLTALYRGLLTGAGERHGVS